MAKLLSALRMAIRGFPVWRCLRLLGDSQSNREGELGAGGPNFFARCQFSIGLSLQLQVPLSVGFSSVGARRRARARAIHPYTASALHHYERDR
jgi:hypothetical protein